MSWRRFPAALDALRNVRQPNSIAGFHRASNGHHCPHGGDSVVNARALRRCAIQNRGSKTLNLSLVSISVLAQRAVELPILHGETLHAASLVEPGQIELANDAAVLAIDLEALFEIAAHRNGQVEMAQTPIGEIHAHKPAVGAEPLQQAGLYAGNLPTQESGAVHQMAAVRQH